MHFKIQAFRAINDLQTCLRYKEAHRNVLLDYGITNITTNTDEWMYNPNIYCVVVKSLDNEIVLGGVRIQVADGIHQLPVEKAIGKMDPNIFEIVNKYRESGGIGELCALFNSKSISGIGISIILVRAGIAISNKLNINTLTCICAEYTLKMFEKVGFRVDNAIGLKGAFPYPNPNYIARVLGILNPESLHAADNEDKQRIESLRTDPNQTFIEEAINQKIKVDYSLAFDN